MYQSIDSFYWQILYGQTYQSVLSYVCCISIYQINAHIMQLPYCCTIFDIFIFPPVQFFLYSCSHPCYCYVYKIYIYICTYTFCDTDAIHKMHNNILNPLNVFTTKFALWFCGKMFFFSRNIIKKKSVIISRETTENADFCVNLLLSPFIL